MNTKGLFLLGFFLFATLMKAALFSCGFLISCSNSSKSDLSYSETVVKMGQKRRRSDDIPVGIQNHFIQKNLSQSVILHPINDPISIHNDILEENYCNLKNFNWDKPSPQKLFIRFSDSAPALRIALIVARPPQSQYSKYLRI